MYGVWLAPGVVAGLTVRRPGAAFYAAFVAAMISVVLGSPWGLVALVYGAVQGAAPELVFAMRGYRRAGLGTAIIAAATTGLYATGLDLILYYPTWSSGWKWLYATTVVVSGIVIAGLGSWLLARALRSTGVLDALPATRISTSQE
jgi:energy-coupling factor transport system substrate-specific component